MLYLKKMINKNGSFEKNQDSKEWTFQPWEGEPYIVINREIVPVDTYSDYRVSGVISKGDRRKVKIRKIFKVEDDWSPEFNIVY